MGKTEIFKSHPYKLTSLHAEDYFFWAELALAGYRFANIPKKLIIVRTENIPNSFLIRIFTENLPHIISMISRSNLVEINRAEIVEHD
jgi:predicted nuclease of predicted toxin-antitoxin system